MCVECEKRSEDAWAAGDGSGFSAMAWLLLTPAQANGAWQEFQEVAASAPPRGEWPWRRLCVHKHARRVCTRVHHRLVFPQVLSWREKPYELMWETFAQMESNAL